MINQNVKPIIFLSVLAKYAEAGVLYFNNPGNRPAGYTSQVLDPRSIACFTSARDYNGSGLKGAGVRRRGPQYASLLTHPYRNTTYAIEFKFLTPSAFDPRSLFPLGKSVRDRSSNRTRDQQGASKQVAPC